MAYWNDRRTPAGVFTDMTSPWANDREANKLDARAGRLAASKAQMNNAPRTRSQRPVTGGATVGARTVVPAKGRKRA